MKIATFNVRTDTPVDGENRWQFRKGLILDKLTAEQPDVIGFQETTPVMADFIKKVYACLLVRGLRPQRRLSGRKQHDRL